ncbi:hypothetical protein PG984_015502 [Apiospora sp. TS-2023a]
MDAEKRSDTTVTVEDLSNVNVEYDDETVQRLLNSLRPALVNDSSTPDYEFHEYTMSQDKYGVIIEEFILNGFKVHRRTFNMFDAKDMAPKGYSTWARARDIQDQATKRAKLDELTVDETLSAIASLLFIDKAKPENDRRFLNKEGKLRRKNAETWPALKTELHGQMFRTRDDPDKRCQVMQGFDVRRGRTDPEYEACFQMAKDIVILRDRNHELINGVITEATQKLFLSDPNLVKRMDRAARAFAWRYPYEKPDPTRHGTTYDHHLIQKPSRDPRSPSCPETDLHRAVCGVEHYGLRTELVNSGLAGLRLQKFSQAKHSFGTRTIAGPGTDAAWRDEFPKLLTGLYGLATKQLRESLIRWDPVLHDECVTIHNRFPKDHQLSSLVDPLTEGHRDVTDWKHGLAGLVTFGDFNQGGDLVLKELGDRISFPSGSHCHLRGRELHHSITEYSAGNNGGLRHSLVMTNKESVRTLYHKTLDPGVKVIEAVVAQAVSAGEYTPRQDETDDDLVRLWNAGLSTDFRQLAFEVQMRNANEEARDKKRRKVDAADKECKEKPKVPQLGPLAKKAAQQAALVATVENARGRTNRDEKSQAGKSQNEKDKTG